MYRSNLCSLIVTFCFNFFFFSFWHSFCQNEGRLFWSFQTIDCVVVTQSLGNDETPYLQCVPLKNLVTPPHQKEICVSGKNTRSLVSVISILVCSMFGPHKMSLWKKYPAQFASFFFCWRANYTLTLLERKEHGVSVYLCLCSVFAAQKENENFLTELCEGPQETTTSSTILQLPASPDSLSKKQKELLLKSYTWNNKKMPNHTNILGPKKLLFKSGTEACAKEKS